MIFEGGSPKVRKEAGLPDLDVSNPDRPIKSPGKIPSATRHAEEDIANQFVEAVEKLGIQPGDVVGTLKIHQSNPSGVCPTCLSGLGNPTKAPGVIKQLSMKYPNLTIEVTSEMIEGVKVRGRLNFRVRNGMYID